MRAPGFYVQVNHARPFGRAICRLFAVTEERKPHPSLTQLDQKLRAARAKREDKARERPNEGLGIGLRIAVELAAAIGVGTAIGILLDRWLGTTPWLLIVFFIIGCVAAFLNVYRVGQEVDKQRKRRLNPDETKNNNE